MPTKNGMKSQGSGINKDIHNNIIELKSLAMKKREIMSKSPDVLVLRHGQSE